MKKNVKETSVLVFLLLVIAFNSSATPVIEWERSYFPDNYSSFYDVIETSDSGFLVAGWSTYSLSSSDSCLFKFDSSGNLQWAIKTEFFSNSLRRVLQVDNLDFVALGEVKVLPTSNVSLFLFRASSTGEILWSKVYEHSDSKTYGYDLIPLEDGGFAACGKIDPIEGKDQAWILRTDSQGDTLWTREWGWDYDDEAVKVFYIDNGLTVLIHGSTSSSPRAPHLIRYDMDGNLLWETYIDYPHSGPGPFARSMCLAGDGGYYILIGGMGSPPIVHIDSEGNVIWPTDEIDFLPQTSKDMNYSDRLGISSTMDGGYIYCGEYMSEGPGPYYVDYGWIYRDNWDGSRLWSDYIDYSTQGCVAINSVKQLSQGGYIAAGVSWKSGLGDKGFLIKYAPELGIENSDYPSVVTINSISPNPLSSSAIIQFSLVEAGTARLILYDLNGREIDTISEGIFSSGTNTVNWNTPSGLSNGCYLIHLETTAGNDVNNLLVLR